MNCQQTLLFCVLALFTMIPTSVPAQLWSGIIDPSRAVDWSDAGTSIPNRTTTCLTLDSKATYTDINNAIARCPSGQVVYLGAGTYNLEGGITFAGRSNVTLRGAGPTQTILRFEGYDKCDGLRADICISNSRALYYGASQVQPATSNAATWSGGYARGATTITLSDVPRSALSVGSIIILDQANDQSSIVAPPAGATENGTTVTITTASPHHFSAGQNVTVYGIGIRGYNGVYTITATPTGTSFQYTDAVSGLPPSGHGDATVDTGGYYTCDADGGCHQTTETPSFAARTINGVHRNQQQLVRITAINGNTYTISPSLYASNWRSSQTPGAWWTGAQVTSDGVENLTLDHSGSVAISGMAFVNSYQCWARNIRSIDSNQNHVWLYQSSHNVVRDSYFYGTQRGASKSYGIEIEVSSDHLIENNIFQHVTAPAMMIGNSGTVWGYNYSIDNYSAQAPHFMTASVWSHSAGNDFVLSEGNQFDGITCDNFHGSGAPMTAFRNALTGWYEDQKSNTVAVQLYSLCRGYNIIGNVLGTPGIHTQYEVSPTSGSTTQCQTSIYQLGFKGSSCGDSVTSPPNNDPLVERTLFRWGNYDVVSGSVQWNSAELPTSAAPYISGNSVPSSHTLPASFYLAVRPSFFLTPWGTPPWPPIGPDVSDGSGPGGYAYPNPAQLCYKNTPLDTTYSSDRILYFDSNKCRQVLDVPAAPSALGAVVH
jgi:hypothetical protein